MNSRGKLIILFLVFVGATGFFLWLLNGVLTRIRASEDKVNVFFEKKTFTASAGETIPVNVMFQTLNPKDKISAGMVSLSYTPRTLTFEAPIDGKIDATCVYKDFSLKTLFNVKHDKAKGIISMSRVLVVPPDSEDLPPRTQTLSSCFATFYFKAQLPAVGTFNAFNPVGRVSFNREAESCEFAGPVDKTYTCDFADRTNAVTVRVGQSRLTPTPSKNPVEPGKECGRCGTIAGIECEEGLACLQPNQPDSEGTCVKPDNSSRCRASAGAHLSFDPLRVNATSGKIFNVDVIIDAGTHSIFATDTRLQFDPQKLEVVEIKDGSYFQIPYKRFQNLNSPLPKCRTGGITGESTPDENQTDSSYDLNQDGIISAGDYAVALQKEATANPTFISKLIEKIKGSCPNPELSKPGSIYIAGVVDEPKKVKTGRGVLATIVFRPKSGGNSHLSVVCRPGETTTDSNIVASEGQYNVADVIDCKANGQTQIALRGGGQSCERRSQGDCNCDGNIDIVDFEPLRKEKTGEVKSLKCDFNNNGKIGLDDFNIWRTGFFADRRPKPSVIVRPSIYPSIIIDDRIFPTVAPTTIIEATPTPLPID